MRKYRFILYPFMGAALVGLLLSLVAFSLAVAGFSQESEPWLFFLHVYAMLVGAVGILVGKIDTKDFPTREEWKAMMRGCPTWMRWIVYGLGVFAFVNFGYWAILGTQGHEPPGMAIFGGHWMAFHAAAFATLYSSLHSEEVDSSRRCCNGHWAAPDVKFCGQCGSPLA